MKLPSTTTARKGVTPRQTGALAIITNPPPADHDTFARAAHIVAIRHGLPIALAATVCQLAGIGGIRQ